MIAVHKGKFIVFEGVDGSGKTTQIGRLATTIRHLDKYQEVLLAREPTRNAKKIRRKLETDANPDTGGNEMAYGYVKDRSKHYFSVIKPSVKEGICVLCDRFSLSTIAYQSTQGEDRKKLLEMHRSLKIPAPDLTFYLHITPKTAEMRQAKRGEPREKFEEASFTRRLIKQYDYLVELAKTDSLAREILGDIIVINGDEPEIAVEKQIIEAYKKRIASSSTGL